MKFAVFLFVACFFMVAATVSATDDGVIEYFSGLIDGPKCAMKTVFNITEVVKQCISDLKDCKEVPNQREQEIINSLDRIVESADDVTDAYEADCNGGDHLGVTCTRKMTNPIINLVGSVVRNAKALSDLLKLPSEMSECAWNSIRGMDLYLWSLPKAIKDCFW